MTETVDITRQSPLWSVGRRKTAAARVRVVPGEGRLFVNGKAADDFFGGNERHKAAAMSPFKVAKTLASFDVFVTTTGGGITGQADAIKLGVARAMVAMDPKLRTALRAKGMLTRDPRAVERKKSGQPKARKRFQHSKR
jgi:small subunit ribosomal protein S9